MTTLVEANEERYEVVKDPAADLDYALSWVDWLPPGDVITALAVRIEGPDAALIAGSGGDSFTDDQTTSWLAGGTEGHQYRVIHKITTDNSRVTERTLYVQIIDR